MTEAAISRCALIVSNVGGPPEFVEDRGLFFEPGDVRDLAEKLRVFLFDEDARERSASLCRDYFLEFTPIGL